MNTDGIKQFHSNIYASNEDSRVNQGSSTIKPAESRKQMPTSSSHYQQEFPSLAQREFEHPKIHLLRGHIGGDPSPSPRLPSLEECLVKLVFKNPIFYRSPEDWIFQRLTKKIFPDFYTIFSSVQF